MGVVSDGSYDIDEGLMYSFPVTIADRKISIVKGLTISDFAKEKMENTKKELIDERVVAEATCDN